MSDFHRMTFTVFRWQFTRQKPIKIQYRDYSRSAEKFCNAINKHAPLKSKTIRGNQAPFMNKELAIRSSLKNIFIKDKNKQNWQAFAKQRNKCTKLRKKAIKSHFAKVTGNGMMRNRCFGRLLNRS